MAIDVHTDTNNNVIIDVQARSTQANVDVVPTTPTQNNVETYPIYGPKGEKGEKGDKGDKGDPGTTDYTELENKPIFSTGLTNNNNTITVTDYGKLVKNTAIGTNSLTILGTPTGSSSAINIGRYSDVTAPVGIAIGSGAKVKTSSGIQLGFGTNYSFTGLQVYSYPLLDGETGKIPAERIKTFVFEQGIASDTWVIEHNLNKEPSVFAVDSTGFVQIPNEVEYMNGNKIIAHFLGAFTGKAYLN